MVQQLRVGMAFSEDQSSSVSNHIRQLVGAYALVPGDLMFLVFKDTFTSVYIPHTHIHPHTQD